MMFNFGWGSRARVFGIDVFGDSYEKWYWYAFIWPVYRVGRSIRDGIWWLRYRIDPRHRYHMINTHLPPRYYDIDTLMLHGMFSLLRRYVEDERGGVEETEGFGRDLLAGGPQDFMHEVEAAQGGKEMEAAALYRWWTETYPAMEKRRNELMRLLYGRRRRTSFTKVEDGELYQMHVSADEGEEIAWRKELDEIEERIDREEQEMLHRLVDIRRSLWT